MKIVAKKDRKLLLINTGNTQNENKAETIELTVPEEYEDYNKKIVFVTDNGIVWDIIQDNTYKLTKAITKYKQVDFYIWLTKDDVDFRSKTMPLRFYHNEDASDEITPEEISGVNTVVNILEEEITKVDSLETELRALITDIQNKLDNGEFDGEDGYTPQKGIDYFTEQDIEEIEGDILNEVYTKPQTDTLLEGKADIEDIPDVSNFITKDVNNLTNYTLKTNTGSLIDLEINDTTYVVTLKLKTQDGTVISTDTIDLPLESVVVGGNYDSTNKKIVLTLENGNIVDIPVGDLIAGLQTEITSQNKLASDLVDDTNSGNKFVTTSEKQTWNNKLDESDLTDYVKNTDYASSSKGGVIKTGPIYGTMMRNDGYIIAVNRTYEQYQNDYEGLIVGKKTLENVIAGKQLINQTQLKESQETQDEEIEKLQEENARFKATLPTTTGTGQLITLDKTAELEFKKPPLPMGNSEQVQYSGKNKIISFKTRGSDLIEYFFDKSINNSFIMSGLSNLTVSGFKVTIKTSNGDINLGYKSIETNKNFSFTFSITTDDLSKIQNSTSTPFIQFWSSNGFAEVDFKNVMIRDSSITDDTYEPYVGGQASPNPDYPQEITNVTGNVEVVVENKNFFDGEFELGTIDNSGVKQNSSTAIRTVNFIPINPNTQYILSSKATQIRSVFYDKDYRFVGTHPASFTSKENEYYMKFVLSSTDLQTEAQLEKGSTATDYVEHKEQVLPLTLGNIELCKIGDYQDYFYKSTNNKWYKHSEIGKRIITANDITNVSNSYSNIKYYRFSKLSIDNNYNKYTGSDTLYSHGIGIHTVNFDNSSNIGKYLGNADTPYYWFGFSVGTTLEQAQESLNNSVFYYTLKTPTDTEITNTTLISQLEAINNALSYEEQTNIIGSSNGSNPIFSVEGYQNTKLILQDISNAIVALGGV